MANAERLTPKAVVVGAGPSGLLAAIALADTSATMAASRS